MADSMSIGVVQKMDYASPNKSEIKDLEGIVETNRKSQVRTDSVKLEDTSEAVTAMNEFFGAISSLSVSFFIDADLNRTIVTVRDNADDSIVRQFPPEEFVTVAKFISAQNPETIDEDYLKGILFDQYT